MPAVEFLNSTLVVQHVESVEELLNASVEVVRSPSARPFIVRGNRSLVKMEIAELELEMKIAELERKLKEEKESYDPLQFEASQEVDRHSRDCQGCAALREREQKDQDRIQSLLEELERKEREHEGKFVLLNEEKRELESKLSKLAHEIVAEFARKESELKEKFVALAKENRDLEHEVNEWKNKYEKLRANDLRGEREHKGRFVDEGDCGGDCYDDEEVIIQLHQHRKKKSSEVAGRAKKAAEPAIGRQEVADETVQAYWKKAYLKKAYHKRNAVNQTSHRSYTGRFASSKQLAHALKRAETLQCNLKSCNPSFIKHMVRSHVSSGFWLGLPQKFCKKNLPTHVLEMILEDERGVVHKVRYLGGKVGLSGGWRGFALYYNLEIGDALLFELTEPTRFKVYIIKAIPEEACQDFDDRIAGVYTDATAKQPPKRVKKRGRCI